MAIGTTAAILGAAALGTAGSVYSASKSSKAVKDSTAAANAEQARQYDLTRADQAPWRDAGVSALGRLNSYLEPGADLNALLQAQPGYQSGLQEGVRAIDASSAAAGLRNSGGTLKALTQFGQDYGSNQLDKIWNHNAALAGIGQTATNQLGALGQNYANNVSDNLLAAGQARSGIQTGLYGKVNFSNPGDPRFQGVTLRPLTVGVTVAVRY